MSISDMALRHMARLRERLQSMLPGQQPRIGDPVDCERPVTVDEVHMTEMAEDLGPENLAALVGAFALDLNETADRMKAQMSGGDASGVRRAAHRMKGLFAQFGVRDLAQLAAKVEASESGEMNGDAAQLLDYVPAAIEAVQQASRKAGAPS
jgi:HPt (histidine-containing phosphotransfer) domain-containing protein